MPLAGNICVAYLTGSTFIFGGGAYGYEGMEANIIPFFLSFLATMSRELAKAIEDIEGDRHGNARTLPIIVGERPAGFLAAAFAVIAICLSYLAPFGEAYIAIVSVANIFLLASVVKIVEGNAPGAQRALKLGMAVALVSFAAAAITQNAYLWAK